MSAGPSDCPVERFVAAQSSPCVEQEDIGARHLYASTSLHFKVAWLNAPMAWRTCPVNREEIYSINSRPAGCDGNVQWPRVVHSCGGCQAGFEGIDCNRVSIPVDAEAGPIDTLKTIDVNGDQHDDIVFLQNGRLVMLLNNGGHPSTWPRVFSDERDILAFGAGHVMIDGTEQSLIISVRPAQNQDGFEPETVRIYACAFSPGDLFREDTVACNPENLIFGENPVGLRPSAVEVGYLDWNQDTESTESWCFGLALSNQRLPKTDDEPTATLRCSRVSAPSLWTMNTMGMVIQLYHFARAARWRKWADLGLFKTGGANATCHHSTREYRAAHRKLMDSTKWYRINRAASRLFL